MEYFKIPAILLNFAQLLMIGGFLLTSTTDNLPFFVFLITVSAVSLPALIIPAK